MCFLYLTLKRFSKSNSIKYLKNPVFRIFLVILNLAVLLIWVQFFNLGSVAELMLEKPDRRTDFSCLHCIKCTNVTFKSKFKIRSGCKSCSVILLKKLFKIFIFIFFKITKYVDTSGIEYFNFECERSQKCCGFKQNHKRLCCNDNCNYLSNYENFPKELYSCEFYFYLSFTLAFVLFVILIFFFIDFLCIKKAMNYEKDIKRKMRRLAIAYV